MTLELFPFIEHHLKGQNRRCLRMLAKRGLIRRYGKTKMNKVKPKTNELTQKRTVVSLPQVKTSVRDLCDGLVHY